MKKKKKRLDDRGLTLIELLLAVLILSVVAAPLLHSFVTSAATAGRSRDMGDATLAAQNVAESVDALLVHELAARMGTGGSLMGTRIENPESDVSLPDSTEQSENHVNGASYSFELHGIESGRNSYDALVTLDASAYASANSVEVTQYTPMDAVFSQPGGQYENPDTLTYEDFASQATALSGEYHAPAEFIPITRRTLDIDLNELGGIFTVTTTFRYLCTYNYSLTITGADGRTEIEYYSEELSATYAYEFFREKLRDGNAPSLTSIYYFYYPNYFGPGTYDDYITIHNEGDVQFSLFLIKQKALDYSSAPFNGVYPTLSDGVISAYDAGYNADVSLMESSAVSSPVATLYSNLNQDVSGREAVPGATRTVRFRAFRGKHWYVDGVIQNKLVATAQENRFFELRVAVYDAGALSDRDGDIAVNPRYTLVASKLD